MYSKTFLIWIRFNIPSFVLYFVVPQFFYFLKNMFSFRYKFLFYQRWIKCCHQWTSDKVCGMLTNCVVFQYAGIFFVKQIKMHGFCLENFRSFVIVYDYHALDICFCSFDFKDKIFRRWSKFIGIHHGVGLQLDPRSL